MENQPATPGSPISHSRHPLKFSIKAVVGLLTFFAGWALAALVVLGGVGILNGLFLALGISAVWMIGFAVSMMGMLDTRRSRRKRRGYGLALMAMILNILAIFGGGSLLIATLVFVDIYQDAQSREAALAAKREKITSG